MRALNFAKWGNDLYTGEKSYDIVGKRKRFYVAALVCLALTITILLVRGINLGIEFRGGSQFMVTGSSIDSQQPALDAVASVKGDELARVSNIGSDAIRVQTNELSDTEVTEVRSELATAYDVPLENVSSTFVGPTWGQDVSKKALAGIVVFLLLVMAVMSIYFRAWRMAAAAILALFHDLVLTIGVYALVGWEVTPATIIGLLTILGYSIYDTVVVFDKVRENTEDISEQHLATYAERANLAVNQTLVRSINTSVVALLPVGSILFIGAFLLGAGTLRDIALSLFVGMAVGAYSSIFLATPLEVSLRLKEPAIAQHTQEVLALRAGKSLGSSHTTAEFDGAAVGSTGTITAGQHLGNKAQPKRRRK
ncbi:protein translocase subunit SecF [Timonella sp. A28]|uniref:protein translocase subunit SecF n=1 Tax=Timonella sp. A28 TaxID=3442640 RepID=UPI003EBF2C12